MANVPKQSHCRTGKSLAVYKKPQKSQQNVSQQADCSRLSGRIQQNFCHSNLSVSAGRTVDQRQLTAVQRFENGVDTEKLQVLSFATERAREFCVPYRERMRTSQSVNRSIGERTATGSADRRPLDSRYISVIHPFYRLSLAALSDAYRIQSAFASSDPKQYAIHGRVRRRKFTGRPRRSSIYG